MIPLGRGPTLHDQGAQYPGSGILTITVSDIDRDDVSLSLDLELVLKLPPGPRML